MARWWGPIADPQTLRDDLHNDGSAFAVLVDGGVAGWLGYEEELTDNYRYVSLDILLAVEHQGRGLGRATLRSAVRHFAARGHHRFTIDPAVDNARAIRTYEAVGFRPVGVMRSYERGNDRALPRQPADGPAGGGVAGGVTFLPRRSPVRARRPGG